MRPVLLPRPLLAAAGVAAVAAIAGISVALGDWAAPSTASASPGGGYHGWCVNAPATTYLVLQDTGAPPELVVDAARLRPSLVVGLHGSAQLAYFALPSRRSPAGITAVGPDGRSAAVLVTACASGPPPTA